MADRIYGEMVVVNTDQMRGRQYRCACGMRAWSCFGRARAHAQRCPVSGAPACTQCGERFDAHYDGHRKAKTCRTFHGTRS